MKTFYDILKIKQNATVEEIIAAYNRLEKKYKNDSQNLKNIQIAKEILTNPEARENYDNKLNEIKQNELISNIENNTLKYNIKKQEDEKIEKEKNSQVYNKSEEIENRDIKKANNKEKLQDEKNLKEEKRQKRKIEKLLKKEEKKKKQIYEEAYAKYLESLGFEVKRKWTFERIKKLVISIIFIIIICAILWLIPTVREKLIKLYENNFIIKLLVDLIRTIVETILSGIKRFMESW